MKKNILSVIGAATVAAVALKLTTKYVKNEVIKELEDDGYLYDDDDCDDCDECCGCDERIDDIHHAPVAAVHVIRVERKHDETKRILIKQPRRILMPVRMNPARWIPIVRPRSLRPRMNPQRSLLKKRRRRKRRMSLISLFL